MKKLLLFLCTIFICTIAVATTVNLNWLVDNTNYTQTTCQTGGDLILPATPPAKYGYTFRGWRVWITLPLNSLDYQSDWKVIANDGDVTYQTDEVTFTLTSAPSSNFSLRGSPSFSLSNKAGHKLYITYQIYLSKAATSILIADTNGRVDDIQTLRNISGTKTNVWQTCSLFGSVHATEYSYQLQAYPLIKSSNWTVGDYYKIRKYRVFDLTETFGAGNEPTTLEAVENALPTY